jgi:predicted transcriptional regulator
MERKEEVVSTNTRYPKSLHALLMQLAREHQRSFNAEVVWALQQYVKQEDAQLKSEEVGEVVKHQVQRP